VLNLATSPFVKQAHGVIGWQARSNGLAEIGEHHYSLPSFAARYNALNFASAQFGFLLINSNARSALAVRSAGRCASSSARRCSHAKSA
jgi:hypothetical protein